MNSKNTTVIKYLDSINYNSNNYVKMLSGIIFKDQDNDQSYIQLKLQNTSIITLQNVYIKILCFDRTDDRVIQYDNLGEFEYLELNCLPDQKFGTDVAIQLPLSTTFDVRIIIYKAISNSGMELSFFSDILTHVPEFVDKIIAKETQIAKRKENSPILAAKKLLKNEKFIKNLIRSTIVIVPLFILGYLSFIFVPYFANVFTYNSGIKYYEQGQYKNAIEQFSKLDNFKYSTSFLDSSNRLLNRKNAKQMYNQSISIGDTYSLAAKRDGKVVWSGNEDFNNIDVQGWENIVAVSAGLGYVVGLNSDGKVLISGDNSNGLLNFDDWSNIKSIESGPYTTVGVKTDGSVISVGPNFAGQNDISNWTDIQSVAVGVSHIVGLKSDGTVVASGSNIQGQIDVSDWNDIVKVVTGEYHTVGLKSDGTLVFAGYNGVGQGNISHFTNIDDIAAGYYNTIVVDRSGNIAATGVDVVGEISFDSKEWNNIVAVFAGSFSTVAIKEDGSILSAGSNIYNGYISKAGWNNIGRMDYSD